MTTKTPEPLFLGKNDIRKENRELAFKMVFREIKNECLSEKMRFGQSCSMYATTPLSDRILGILKRWNVAEQEIGGTLSLAITFPDDVARNQYFLDKDGKVFTKHVPAKIPVLPKRKSILAGMRKKLGRKA